MVINTLFSHWKILNNNATTRRAFLHTIIIYNLLKSYTKNVAFKTIMTDRAVSIYYFNVFTNVFFHFQMKII